MGILLSLHVDDMIIIRDDVDGIVMLKSNLVSCVRMKDLSFLPYFLGIEIAYSVKSFVSRSLNT